jgi:hypothetical protein
MDTGQRAAQAQAIQKPLPVSWLGRVDAPLYPPNQTTLSLLTNQHIRTLQAQIAYDLSSWDSSHISLGYRLGKYQIFPKTLSDFGLIIPGAYEAHGADCVNYPRFWQSTTVTIPSSFVTFVYNVTDINSFFADSAAQDHLALQMIYQLYNSLKLNGAIQSTDTADVVAGMLYVGWTLGAGVAKTANDRSGTGAYAWRYSGIGDGINSYNSGRYAVTVLSQ